MATVEFRSESYKNGILGQPDLANRIIYEYAIGPDGRRASKVFFVKEGEDPPRLMQDIRIDGTKRIILQYIPKSSETVDQIRVSNIEDRGSVFAKGMNEVLWIIAPGGRPLYERLNAEVDLSVDQEKRPVIGFVLDGGRHVTCTLDRDRDWLPVHVNLRVAESEHVYDVKRFEKDNGRWFPMEGTMRTQGNRSEIRSFLVTNLRINRGIPDSTFTMPQNLEKGVAIFDETSKERLKVVGGRKARDLFAAKYASAFAKMKSEGEPLVVPRDVPTSALPGTIAVLSVLLIGIAAIIHFLDRRRSS